MNTPATIHVAIVRPFGDPEPAVYTAISMEALLQAIIEDQNTEQHEFHTEDPEEYPLNLFEGLETSSEDVAEWLGALDIDVDFLETPFIVKGTF